MRSRRPNCDARRPDRAASDARPAARGGAAAAGDVAVGVRFLNGANHRMFPFAIVGGSWAEHFDLITGLAGRGDTVVGNDVWLGYQSMVLPGVRIGHGAIVAAGSVVVDDVPDYGIVGGNPATLIRRRYSASDIERLLAIAWWDWPLEQLTAHVRTIMSGSVDELEVAARDVSA